jgi:hypothetical protein
MGLVEAPKGLGSHEFKPLRQRCLMGKLRLDFGQDLHGQENSSPNQNTSQGVSEGFRLAQSERAVLGGAGAEGSATLPYPLF